MASDGERGGFSADIPDDAIAAALAAVEKRPPSEPATVTPLVREVAPAPGEGGPPGGAEPPSEADRLRAELDLSQERARKVFEQLKAEHDRALRAAADLDNYKKRAAREKEEVLRYGNERLVKELLPVVDNLDRALAVAPEGEPLAAGVELTRRALLDALGRFGVKAFSALGQPFDPRFHEALMTVATADHAPGTVLEEQQRGYLLHDRLIRPAAVVVAAPAAAQGGTPGDAP